MMAMKRRKKANLTAAYPTRRLVAVHRAVDSDRWVHCRLQPPPAQSSSALVCYSKSTGLYFCSCVCLFGCQLQFNLALTRLVTQCYGTTEGSKTLHPRRDGCEEKLRASPLFVTCAERFATHAACCVFLRMLHLFPTDCHKTIISFWPITIT